MGNGKHSKAKNKKTIKMTERKELIDKLMEWKLRSPVNITLFIEGREVVLEREVELRLKKPELPRTYGTLFEYKDRKPRHSIFT